MIASKEQLKSKFDLRVLHTPWLMLFYWQQVSTWRFNWNGQLFVSNHSVVQRICHPVTEPAEFKFEYSGERTFVHLHKYLNNLAFLEKLQLFPVIFKLHTCYNIVPFFKEVVIWFRFQKLFSKLLRTLEIRNFNLQIEHVHHP